MNTSELLTLVVMLFNIALLEVMLSFDNAAVIALRVQHLPDGPRQRATYYGVVGGIVFRGLLLFMAGFILQLFWLKILGGLYLLYIAYKGLTEEEDNEGEGIKTGPGFWMTVLIVEYLDLVFSLDNVLAIASMAKLPVITPSLATFGDDITKLIEHSGFWIAAFGTVIGMLGMRFASSIFSRLLDKFPSVSRIALWVVGLLGVKITLTGILDFFPVSTFRTILESHETDMAFSFLILIMFLWPMLRQLVTRKRGKRTATPIR
ncbi:TerC family protein [Spirosoma lituiforme]